VTRRCRGAALLSPPGRPRRSALTLHPHLQNTKQQGPELTSFAEFTADFPPDLKGLAIGNSDAIRAAHNAFARPDPILQDDKKRRDDEEGEAFHFVAYVPRGGTLWDLDGLREGPIPLCDATDGDWLDKVRVADKGPCIRGRDAASSPAHSALLRSPLHALNTLTPHPPHSKKHNRSAPSCSRASTASRPRARSAST
jgi:hypothetical protein